MSGLLDEMIQRGGRALYELLTYDGRDERPPHWPMDVLRWKYANDGPRVLRRERRARRRALRRLAERSRCPRRRRSEL